MAKNAQKANEGQTREVVIPPPHDETAVFTIRGTSPLVLNAFSQKARQQITDKQMAGSAAKKGKAREAKDFNACYEGAKHVSEDGWLGFSAAAIRAAVVSACRIIGFKMTLAKLSVFVLADGYDKVDGTPLVRITKGVPSRVDHPVILELGGRDIRSRPMWKPGWEAILRIQYNADLFTLDDIANLLVRVGRNVGIGEGRPDSKKSCGMGWGLFDIVGKKTV